MKKIIRNSMRDVNKNYIVVWLVGVDSGKSEVIKGDLDLWIGGTEVIEGSNRVWMGEEYMVVEVEVSMVGKKVEVLDDEGKVIEDGICIGVEDDEVLIYDRGEGFSCEKKNCRVVW